jgi:glucokinase
VSAPTWLGIDLGGTSIKWEQLSDSGETVASGRVATPRSGHHAVTDAIAQIVIARDADGDRPFALGIAVPGHLSVAGDTVTLLPNVSGEWLDFPVAARLSALTGVWPALLNDARAFAVAEMVLGAARSHSDVVFATVGTGVGGAVALDGQVIRSKGDRFGEVGHTIAVVDGEPCTCGNRGCVEAYSGGAQILRRARREGLTVRSGPGALQALSSHPRAAGILRDAYDALAIGISNTCALTGAPVVVIGGGVAEELPYFLDRTRQRLAERRRLLGDVEVRPGELGVRAGALGAAMFARTECLQRTVVTAHGSPTKTLEQVQ